MRTKKLKSPCSSQPPLALFEALIERVRAGDAEACETLVREYNGVILREARLRLGSQYSSFLDAEDVVQSVLRSFLLRAREGRFCLSSPAQLVGLLTLMARNKAFTALRRESRRKISVSDENPADLASRRTPCDEQVSNWELIGIYRQRMKPDEWQLLQWRLDGDSWPDIAQRAGQSPGALRKRLQRALDRLRARVTVE
jgi:RNA polymerase sigma factor (sigma-70 family)